MLLRYLKVAILALISMNTLFMLICIASDYWVILISTGEVQHWGLWRVCKELGCIGATGGQYTKTLLILGFIFSCITILLASLELKYGANGTLGCLKLLAVMNFSVAFVELIGMVRGTFIFPSKASFSWSYILGWVAVAMAICAGAFSVFNHIIEPAAVEPSVHIKVGQSGNLAPSAGIESISLPEAEVPPAYEIPPPSYDQVPALQPHPQVTNDVATIIPVTVA